VEDKDHDGVIENSPYFVAPTMDHHPSTPCVGEQQQSVGDMSICTLDRTSIESDSKQTYLHSYESDTMERITKDPKRTMTESMIYYVNHDIVGCNLDQETKCNHDSSQVVSQPQEHRVCYDDFVDLLEEEQDEAMLVSLLIEPCFEVTSYDIVMFDHLYQIASMMPSFYDSNPFEPFS
jgi:hypothetical protein